jgi:hypothetical protein
MMMMKKKKKKKMSVGRYDLAGKDSVVEKDHSAFCILFLHYAA